MSRARLPQPRLRVLAVALASCYSAAALALPTAPVVTNGSASFQQTGSTLTVTNSNGTTINWNSFSVGSGETTHFIQPSASSSVLNRVLGGDPSQIYGTLSSNGRIFLLNPAGIYIGASGRVDAAGFIASTLALSDQDFLAGRLVFTPGGAGGRIENRGTISTPEGGQVYLVASDVDNQGTISAPNGEVVLAAGSAVQLVNTATPGVTVEFTADQHNVQNSGSIAARQIGLAAAVARNSGTLNASAAVSEGGRIFLRASKTVEVDAAGRIVANGTAGGRIELHSDDQTLVSGRVEARGEAGAGGRVEILGDKVGVFSGATVDASGQTGGGTILVGGDLQGKNAAVRNASVTWFGPDAMLSADAVQAGEGGKIVVWADDTTRAYGGILARGGAAGGDGGFVEVSGKRHLVLFGATVDTSAPFGQTGTLLLDPDHIDLFAGTGTAFYAGASFDGAGVFSGGSGNATLFWDSNVSPLLATTNVTLTTSISGYGGDGGIIFNSGNYSSSSTNTLRLLAYGGSILGNGYIRLDGANISLPNGQVELYAGWDGVSASAPALAGNAGSIAMYGGFFGPAGIDAGGVKLAAAKDVWLSGSGAYGAYVKTSGDLYVRAVSLNLSGAPLSTGQGGSFMSSDGGQAFDLGLDGSGSAVGASLVLTGASGSTTYGGFAAIEQRGTASTQTFTFYGANSTVLISGGVGATVGGGCFPGDTSSACSDNSAGIEAKGLGQSFLFEGANGTITLNAGSSVLGVGRNGAEIDYNGTGTQKIWGTSGGALAAANAPRITLNGGGSGGAASVFYGGKWESIANEAIIDSETAQDIASSYGGITLNGNGSALGSYGGAFIVAPNQNIYVLDGDLELNGGYGGGLTYLVETATVIPSGAALIGWDSDANIAITLEESAPTNTFGNLKMNASLFGTTADALIGSLNGRANVSVNAYGGIQLGTSGSSGIGSKVGATGSSISLVADLDGCGGVCDLISGIMLDGSLRVGSTDSIVLTTAGGSITSSSPAGQISGGVLTASGYGGVALLGSNQIGGSVNLSSAGGSVAFKSDLAGTTHVGSATAYAGVIIDAAYGGLGVGGIQSTSGVIQLSAYGAILDDNGAAANIIAPSGVSSVLLDSADGQFGALAISADIDVSASTALNAAVGASASYGGIAIRNVGTSEPLALFLDDLSLQVGALVSYDTPHAVLIDGAAAGISSNLGSIAVNTGGSSLTVGPYGGLVAYGSVLLDGGAIDIAGFVAGDAGVSINGASVGITGYGGISSSFGAVNVATLSNIDATAFVSAYGDVVMSGGAVTAFGSVFSSTGSINLTASSLALGNLSAAGTVTLNGGSLLQTTGGSISGDAGVAISFATVNLGAANVQSANGNVAIAGSSGVTIVSSLVNAPTGTLVVSGGTISADPTSSLIGYGGIDLIGSTLDVRGALTSSAGNLLLSGSSLTVDGIHTAGGSATYTTPGALTAYGDVTANGVTLSGSTVLLSGALVDGGTGNVNVVGGASTQLQSSSVFGSAGVSISGSTLGIDATSSVSGYGGVGLLGGLVSIDGNVSSSGGALSVAGDDVSLAGLASAQNGVALTSAGAVDIAGSVISGGGGDISVIAGTTISMTGGSLDAAAGANNVVLSSGGDIRLNNGSSVIAGDDVFIEITGTGKLYLNDTAGQASPSYILADQFTGVPASIYLNFASLGDGGVVIDGVETTTSFTGASGLFVVSLATPAVLGSTLHITYGGAGVDPVNKEIGTIFDDSTRDTEAINDIGAEQVEELAQDIVEKTEEEPKEEGSTNGEASTEGSKDGKDKPKPGKC